LLRGLFELWLTRAAFEEDPARELIPAVAITAEEIKALVVELGGDLDEVFFRAE
jgi:hypothetical protein